MDFLHTLNTRVGLRSVLFQIFCLLLSLTFLRMITQVLKVMLIILVLLALALVSEQFLR